MNISRLLFLLQLQQHVTVISSHSAYPPDREDFSSDVVVVTFQADEFGPQINDMPAPIVIFDDEINEALEEVFIVVLTLENSTNADGVAITRESSVCGIIDDDGLYCVNCLHLYHINLATIRSASGGVQNSYTHYVTKTNSTPTSQVGAVSLHPHLK